MINNRIRVKLAEHNMSATALSAQIPEMSKVCMSFIVNGTALPTREGMAAMCKALDCLATDIYDEAELNLNVTGGREEAESPLNTAAGKAVEKDKVRTIAAQIESRGGRGHEGQERVFFWFMPEEKTALVKAVKGLGYRSTAEWMREMYRQTLKQYAALKLDGKTLHDLIPPMVKPESPATE